MNLLVNSPSYLSDLTDRMLRHLEGTSNPSIVRVAKTFTPSPTIGLINFPIGTVGEIVEPTGDIAAPQRVRLEAKFNAIDLFVEVRGVLPCVLYFLYYSPHPPLPILF